MLGGIMKERPKPNQWIRSVRERIRSVGRRVRRGWWHWLDYWPLSSVVVFLKALLLLALWLVVVFVVFDLIISPRIQVPGKETVSLLAALITALLGFGVQQWKSQTEEEFKRKQQQNSALKEIRKLSSEFRDSLSEGARRYLELSTRSGRVWKSGRIQTALEEEWDAIRPPALQDSLRLLSDDLDERHFFDVVRNVGVQRSVEVLEWTYKQLDDGWRRKAIDRLLLLSQKSQCRRYISDDMSRVLDETHRCAVLRVWPHLSLWRDFRQSIDPGVAEGLRYFGRDISPFGSGQAETDALLLAPQIRVEPSWFDTLQKPGYELLVGSSGSGKTASALLMIYDTLREQVELRKKDAFPIYFPTVSIAPELNEIASVLAWTLLYYLAAFPTDFLQCSIDRRSAISHLLVHYVRPNFTLRFHQAGLPRSDEGGRLLKEIESLTQKSVFQETLIDCELAALLGHARPSSFRYTIVLLDVQDQAKRELTGEGISTFLDLSDTLARSGVFVKGLLPNHFTGKSLIQFPIETKEAKWSEGLLSQLLNNYLKCFGDDSLAAWCDRKELRSRDLDTESPSSPDQRLVRAAGGTPGGLIRRGNDLLRRIGQRQRLLTARDLDEILIEGKR